METPNRRPSAVSTAIRSTLRSSQVGEKLIEKTSPSEITVKIANTQEEREAVFRLAYDVYLEKGFVNSNINQWLVRDYDFDYGTTILIAKNKNQEVVGSLTLVFDKSSILPAEKIYKDELDDLRASGRKLTEISRLVLRPDHRNSKETLLLLFNYLFIYIYHIREYSHLVIEVNPRHKNYYRTLLDFEMLGEEKSCPSVQDAPANLLHLPLEKCRTAIRHFSRLESISKRERSLYAFFIKPEQEHLVVEYLEKQYRPLTAEEKSYFGYYESGINHAVVV